MEKTYSFSNTILSFCDAEKLFARMIEECESEFNRENDFYAVIVNKTEKSGVINSSELYIFPHYSNCCEILNKYEYTTDVSVELFVVTKNTKTHVKYKCFDACWYSSFPNAKPINHYPDIQYARKLYGMSTTVHVD